MKRNELLELNVVLIRDKKKEIQRLEDQIKQVKNNLELLMVADDLLVKTTCIQCGGKGKKYHFPDGTFKHCSHCDGTGVKPC